MTCTIDVLVGADHLARSLRADVFEGLSARPKQLPPKWFYDTRGSALFDEITRLPEYYLTRSEREILEAHADEIARLSGADTLVEIGSGTSTKTRLILDALTSSGQLRRFVPFDVSEATLREAATDIEKVYPGVDVHGVAGDFELHLSHLPADGKRLVIFLGSTIGNLEPMERKVFLNEIATGLNDQDSFLVGIDLIKDGNRLHAAYNDSAGVTEKFNKNILDVINRELHANFEPARFDHLARFDQENNWIEMYLVSRVAHAVDVPDLDMEVFFDKGEHMRTEISTKFRIADVEEELTGAGMKVARVWTDRAGDFALILATR